jgi:hypothetical protein
LRRDDANKENRRGNQEPQSAPPMAKQERRLPGRLGSNLQQFG